MKRIKNMVAVLAAVVLGTSFAFADKAQYDKLLAEAKQYEEKGKLCSALGTYWDAIGSNPGDAKEADESYKRILEGFIKESDLGRFRYSNYKPTSSSAYSGNPGPGQYDEFSLYDSWLELCKDFETYWNEHPADILDCKITHEKGDLDIKTRTATYTFTATLSYSEKFNAIARHIVVAYYEAYRKDWQKSELHPAWPAVSAFKDSKTTPVVKFLDAKYSKESARNEGIYRPVSLIHQIDRSQNIAISPDKNSEFFVPAWNNLCAVGGKTGTIENLVIQFSIKDESGRTIASTGKPIACTVSPVRYVGSVPNVSYEIQASYIATGISASDIKLLDSGKTTWSIDKLELTPRTTTCTAKTLSYLFDVTVEFQNVKMLAVGSSVDFLNKGKTGFANVDVLKQNEETSAKNKVAYLKDALPQIVLNGKGELSLSDDRYRGYIISYALPEDYRYEERSDIGRVIYFDWKSPGEYISEQDFNKQINDLAGTNYKYWFSKNFPSSTYSIIRALTDEECIQLKKQLIQAGDKDKLQEWANITSNSSNEKEKKLAKEAYKYIKAKEYVAKGKLHTTLNELEIADKKGVVTVKNLPSSFIEKGLQKKDVITQITVTDFLGDKKTIQASELKTVLAPATCVFTVQRGSGKKTQSLDVTIPVEWNIKEERDCDLDR